MKFTLSLVKTIDTHGVDISQILRGPLPLPNQPSVHAGNCCNVEPMN